MFHSNEKKSCTNPQLPAAFVLKKHQKVLNKCFRTEEHLCLHLISTQKSHNTVDVIALINRVRVFFVSF